MKFLEDPYQTLWAGLGLTVGLAILWVAIVGMPSGGGAWVEQLLRWTHFLAGITWIGLLYFFNLINAGFMKQLDAAQKGVVHANAASRKVSRLAHRVAKLAT